MSFQKDYRKAAQKNKGGKTFKDTDCNILFFSNASKKKNWVNIYGRVTINTQRQEFSTRISCLKSQWDTANKIILKEPLKTAQLNDLRTKIEKVFYERKITERSLHPQTVIQIALGLRQHDKDRHHSPVGSRLA